MSSNGSQKIPEEVSDFVKLLTKYEVVNIRFTDLDGNEHELGMRNTREFGKYLLSINLALIQKSPDVQVPKGGYKA